MFDTICPECEEDVEALCECHIACAQCCNILRDEDETEE